MKYRGPLIGLSAFHGRRADAHLAGVCEPATGRGRATRPRIRRCSPTCTGCVRVTTSGWPGSAWAESKRSTSTGNWPKSRSSCRGTAIVWKHRRLGDLPEHRRTTLPRAFVGQGGRGGDAAAARKCRPAERTEPSFDVTALLNGFEPLFSLLNPHDADNLTKGCHRLTAGRHLVACHADQPDIHAHRDIRRTGPGPRRDDHQSQQGGSATLPQQNDNLDGIITQTRDTGLHHSTDGVRNWWRRWVRWHG